MIRKLIICIFILVLASACKKYDYEYYQDGKVKIKAEMKNGKRNGLLLEYYEDGSILSKQEWQDGELSGTVEDYYQSGNIQSKGKFVESKMVKMVDYFESGVVYQNYVIDSPGNIIDIERYLENGIRDSVAFPYAYLIKGDTVNKGDTALFKCIMFNAISPTSKNGRLIISTKLNRVPNAGLLVSDTIAIVYPENGTTYNFKFIPKDSGKKFVYGQLIFDSVNPKTIERTVIDIRYPYFVKD